jgi:hypothetical protein
MVHGTLPNAFVGSQNDIGTWQKHNVGKKHEMRYRLLTAI